MPHVCRRHHPREPKELDRGPGPVSGAEPDDCRRRSQEAWRARLSLGDPGHQALPRGLRSGAENRDVRRGTVRSDDGAIPGLGSQSVVADVWIPGGVAHMNGCSACFLTHDEHRLSELRLSMSVHIEQKSYEMALATVHHLIPPERATPHWRHHAHPPDRQRFGADDASGDEAPALADAAAPGDQLPSHTPP
jgi:hypothetical protein